MTRAEILAVAKPELFNTPMVQAILERRKANTRRLVLPQPVWVEQDYKYRAMPSHWQWKGEPIGPGMAACAPRKVGDYLYVCETWQRFTATDIESGLIENGYIYLVSPEQHDYQAVQATQAHYGRKMKWRPSIYMPKEAARIFLRILSVDLVQLQTDFCEPTSPIIAIENEGIDIGADCRQCIDNYTTPCCVESTDDDGGGKYGGECGLLDENRSAFAALWDSTIKPTERDLYGWNANPWVWSYYFERVVPTDA